MVLVSAKSIAISAGLSLGLSLFSATAEAAVLGKYTFDGKSLTPSDVATGVTLSDFDYDGDATPSFPAGNAPTAEDSISANGWLTSGDFFEFSIAPGMNLITSLDLDLRRSSTGPSKVSVFFSPDGFTTQTLLDEIFPSTKLNPFDSFNIDFGPTGLTGDVAFRLFAGDATTNNGTLRIDNVIFNGEAATAVPTPALLPGLVGLGLSLVRKRRDQAVA